MKNSTLPTASFQACNAYFDVVALAASAGGLNALSLILSRLPDDLPAALLIVQHLHPDFPSMMAEILSRRTRLSIHEATNGDILKAGAIFIAPPDKHMILADDATIELMQSDLVKFVRPSADLLFSSVAAVFKHRAIAVVLTGTGRDGSSGVQAIKKAGGAVIAQNKETSEFFGMPAAAIETGAVDYILPLDQIPNVLTHLIQTGVSV